MSAEDRKIVQGPESPDLTHVEDSDGVDGGHVEKNELGEDSEKAGNHAAVTWTPEEEGKALRKLDWNLIPL